MTNAVAFAIQECALNNVLYPGMRGQTATRGRKIQSEGLAGTVHETFHTVAQQEAMAELQSLALKSLLGALTSSTDLPLLLLDGTNGMVMYGAKGAQASPGFASGSVHYARTALYGAIWISAIRWSVGNSVEVDLRAMFYDGAGSGATDPLAITSVALPTQVIPVEQFALSALTLNGAAVDSVTSLEITFDPKLEYRFSQGNPFPTLIVGAGTKGAMECRLTATVTDLSLAEGTGSVTVTFSQYAAASPTFAAHTVAFTFNAPWTLENQLSGRSGDAQTRELVVRPRLSGSTKPVTWATT